MLNKEEQKKGAVQQNKHKQYTDSKQNTEHWNMKEYYRYRPLQLLSYITIKEPTILSIHFVCLNIAMKEKYNGHDGG
jgi:hypothetical protein